MAACRLGRLSSVGHAPATNPVTNRSLSSCSGICAELAPQDATGLLPGDGVLYLFCDLTWGDPFDFEFVHAPGPTDGWQALPIPPGLPPVYGNEGAYQVP